MRYLVTGAAGFIGSHLTETLLETGHHVVALDSFTPYYDPTLKHRNSSGFQVLNRDLATSTIDEIAGTVDGIFHLAGQPGVRASWGDEFETYTRDNILASQRVFEAAAKHNLRVVFASSSSVYGNTATYPTTETTPPSPVSPYGISKLACEHLAHAYAKEQALDYIALRYFTVYGPRQRPDMAFTRILTALATETPFVLHGDGTQSRSFTFVSDAVEATILAMTHAPSRRTYNVGGGSETTLRNAITICEKIADRKLTLRNRTTATGDVKRTSANTEAITRDLTWTPRIPLEEGLLAQWESHRPNQVPTKVKAA